MTRTCEECGRAFEPVHRTKRFCSKACSGRNYKRRLRELAADDGPLAYRPGKCLCGQPAIVFLPVVLGGVAGGYDGTTDTLPLCADHFAMERRQAAEVNWHYGIIDYQEAGQR